jgi:hypothetical protein
MRAAIHGSLDVLGMIAGVSRRAENSDLATVAIGVRTIKSTPMTLLLPTPVPGFSVCDGLFDLFFGMTRPISHLLYPI